MNQLTYSLMKKGYLKEDMLIDAFSDIDRVYFVPKDLESAAEKDISLPIGSGQTISQPFTVAFMLELLDPQPGQRILDVGSGSGWTTALLAHVVGKKGIVIGLERIKELYEKGKKNVDRYKYISKGIVEMNHMDGNKGCPRHAPYDRILVSASVEEVPKELKQQLKIGGKMVIPVRNSICYLEKNTDGNFKMEQFRGFAFVPLIEESK